MNPLLRVVFLFFAFVLCLKTEGTDIRAYSMQSRELARSTYIDVFYSDTVVKTQSGVWDLDTDDNYTKGYGDGEYGSLLDFDLKSERSLFRRVEASSQIRNGSNVFEVRTKEGAVLFAKKDSVSNKPEAYLVDEGRYVLSRTNDATTFELVLELHSVATGDLIWRRAPGGNPRWRLSQDSLSFMELSFDSADNFFHTAVVYDILSQAELARSDLQALQIARDSDYLYQYDSPVGVVPGRYGTLLSNERSKTLSVVVGFRALVSSFYHSPKLDLDARYLILHAHNAGFGDPNWILVDSRNGERIASNLELGQDTIPLGLWLDPALSSDGNRIYQVVGPGEIEVWNPHTKTLLKELSYTNVPFEILVPSADDRYLLALALSGINDDFMVLLDTETNLPVYSKIVNDPEILFPEDGFGYATGFTRTLRMLPSGHRIYFQTIYGIEAFDFLSGEKIVTGNHFNGKALISRYIEKESCWVIVYQSGKIRFESEVGTTWKQLPNVSNIKYAAIDVESGSVAFQRDTAIFVTHPFDDREDLWIADLDFDVFPISLHGGGRWLGADYRSIYNLETKEWIASPYLYLYDIDRENSQWVEYDSSNHAIVLHDIEGDSSGSLSLAGEFSSIRDLCFSPDGTRIYALVHSESDYNRQCVIAIDLEAFKVESQVDLNYESEFGFFSQMQSYSDGNGVLLVRANGTIRSLDLSTGQSSLPALLEPALNAAWEDGSIDLSPLGPEGRMRFIDASGNLYELEPTTAQTIPVYLAFSNNSESQLLFEEKYVGEYWIQSSVDLEQWSTHSNTEFVKFWFTEKETGFFKVFESVSNN